MLIVTERHTEKDLELWKDYKEIDECNNDQYLANLEIKSSAILKLFCERKAYVCVSWGKDSVVVADMAYRIGIEVPIVHLRCIPSHNNYCDMVRDEFLKIWPSANYHERICDYGSIYSEILPAYLQDNATDKIWKKTWGIIDYEFGGRRITGVRGEESGVRKIRMMRWGATTEKTCAPIGTWKNKNVFAYLQKYNLPVHPNYGMLGGGRWKREYLRVAEIGDIKGNGMGRSEWEREYYGDIINRIMVGK